MEDGAPEKTEMGEQKGMQIENGALKNWERCTAEGTACPTTTLEFELFSASIA